MSLDQAAALKTFFASAPQTKYVIATLQLSHSAMSKTWRLWREPYVGTAGGQTMQPANIDIAMAGSPGHLDQKFDIRIGLVDIEDTFRAEMDRIPINTTEKIVIVIREYLSDNLSTAVTEGTLQVESISYAKGAASISAVSPRLNITRTGELYSPRDIPMLRGFL
ncbi:MAG: hypothetical protein KAX57_00990 [Rhodoferax sp.]|jgi:hypothetical protein|uniref:hypothetical protein n=1 Tax=Rhodoferax sp. TaxID=50421 RepID=UPI001B519654|nr:hypothetical protein [Rhodoferax sp.]MBP8285394.1 hypothetical protein [Rhodoferax sp.]MBP9148712.1 hypothetical protein [Rhodoferax sp.]MBP9736254.1 hypothetical protein [Rhodoferax sp.]